MSSEARSTPERTEYGAVKASAAAKKPAAIAAPPSRGVGCVWILRFSPGRSIAPRRLARLSADGVRKKAPSAAARSAQSARSGSGEDRNMDRRSLIEKNRPAGQAPPACMYLCFQKGFSTSPTFL